MKHSSHPQSRSNYGNESTPHRRSFFSVKEQPSLFCSATESRPGSLNDCTLVRNILIEAIKNSGKSRDQIADEMSALTGTEVTVRRLNGYTAESKDDYRFPAELQRAFCVATGDFQLLKCCAEVAGFHVINSQEYTLLELGRQYLIHKRADDQVKLLESRLGGVEL